MTTITIEELKLRFHDVKEVAPYGWCIVVPGVEFDPDWETNLSDQGYMCHEAVLDRKPVTLVKLAKKDSGARGEKVVYEPPQNTVEKTVEKETSSNKDWTKEDNEKLLRLWPLTAGTVNQKGLKLTEEFPGRNARAIILHSWKLRHDQKATEHKETKKAKKTKHWNGIPELPMPQESKTTRAHKHWTEDENGLLVELWNRNVKVSEIAAAFPERAGLSVKMRIDRLQKEGTIKPRLKGEMREGSAPTQPPISTPMGTPLHAPAVEKLVETLGELTKVVDRLGCQAIMQALEIKELRTPEAFKIPLGIWTAYANALLEDGLAYRSLFREKVKKLLEAVQ